MNRHQRRAYRKWQRACRRTRWAYMTDYQLLAEEREVVAFAELLSALGPQVAS